MSLTISTILGLAGALVATFTNCLTSLMKASQEVAAALTLLDPVVFLIFVWASVILLLFSWAAFCLSLSVLLEQAEIVEMASSSNFLHLAKASLQALRPLAISPTSLILQSLTSSPSLARSALVQQVQASVAVSSLLLVKQSSAIFLKALVDVLHASTRVMLGLGRFMLQVLFTSDSHIFRVSVRFLSCFAPSESAEPLQVRADALPPPTSTSFWTRCLKLPFLPLFLPAISPCFFTLVICLSKLATTFSSFLIDLTADSRHLPSTCLPEILVCFLFLFLLEFPPTFPFFPFFFPFLPLFLFLFTLFLLAFFLLFLPSRPASASLITLEDSISSERLLSLLSSPAQARMTKMRRNPKTSKQALLFMMKLGELLLC